MFNAISKTVDGLYEEFKTNYSKEMIFDALIANSMNVYNTYQHLANPSNTKTFFTSTDDDILSTMKGTSVYNNLINIKGEEVVREREDFLFS